MATKHHAVDTPREQRQPKHRPCCPPRVVVWIESAVSAVHVANSESEQRNFTATADVAVNQALQPPFQVADGASDSKLEVVTTRDQGKVYRMDSYTIHWRATAEAGANVVSLRVDGEVQYDSDYMPDEGRMTLTRAFLLEPPAYQPPGPGFVSATATVVDCAGQRDECAVRVARP